MKKRTPPEPARPEFNNNPFTSLKKLKPSIAVPAHKVAPPVKTSEAPAEDEEALFRRAMSGARRIDDETAEAPAAADRPRTLRQREAVEEDGKQEFLQALRKMGGMLRAPREDDLEEAPRQTASPRARQLKRGTLRIGGELDLHGCLRDEAIAKLRHFLATARSRGQKAVLVITGKGNNSPEGPVLQGAVADWLRGPGRGVVAEFIPAPRDKGGSGAYVVFLRN